MKLNIEMKLNTEMKYFKKKSVTLKHWTHNPDTRQICNFSALHQNCILYLPIPQMLLTHHKISKWHLVKLIKLIN